MTLENTVSQDRADAHTRRVSRRADRLAAQETLWSESSLKRVRHCGRYLSAGNDIGVPVRVSEGLDGSRIAGFGGLQTCGSTWACPVCSAKIASERQTEVETAVRSWVDGGGGVIYTTWTLRHHARQSLRSVWDALAGAWEGVTSGRAWIADQEDGGLGSPVTRVVKSGKRKGQSVTETRVPWLRVVEVTNGGNGWHVHIHCLFFVNAPVMQATADEWTRPMWSRWSDSLVRNGFDAPLREVGLDVQAVDGDVELVADAFGRYFAKNTYDGVTGAAMDVTRSDLKSARHGNRTPFAVLRSVYETGDADDLAVWHEWERASKGRRQMTWSVGLRQLVGLIVEERTDEEIAADDHGGEVVAWITGPAYRRLSRVPGRRAALLAHVERHGGDGLIAQLIAWKVEHLPPMVT